MICSITSCQPESSPKESNLRQHSPSCSETANLPSIGFFATVIASIESAPAEPFPTVLPSIEPAPAEPSPIVLPSIEPPDPPRAPTDSPETDGEEWSLAVPIEHPSGSTPPPEPTDPRVKIALEQGVKFVCVGRSERSSVWATNGSAGRNWKGVLKRGDGPRFLHFRDEIETHTRLLRQFRSQLPSIVNKDWTHNAFQVNFPHYDKFYPNKFRAWMNRLPFFPNGTPTCEAIAMERIWPMPKDARKLLIQNNLDRAADDENNRYSLIRPYLGRRRKSTLRSNTEDGKQKTLNNFRLHVDQMEELGLDPNQYAVAMADALAIMMWVAHIEVCDVKFVLASPRPPPPSGVAPEQQSGADQRECHFGNREFTPGLLGPHAMWVMDFASCRKLSRDSQSIGNAAAWFTNSHPYFPRPDAMRIVDRETWYVFRDRFRSTSSMIFSTEKYPPSGWRSCNEFLTLIEDRHGAPEASSSADSDDTEYFSESSVDEEMIQIAG
ncbi:hypothetical protein B0T16DRAFT_319890 [Cercophora newfieldiana]|uniref:DUF3669 domain-containing protein n=1 Tax=Cercophora newfieldiana TaxID=92897 RepID=A0AA39YMC8_9PEZI|nr:hypothetical protein B0T16DRAFT_319890 [Cercophora newfieldiana]